MRVFRTGDEFSHLILLSDGITDSLSDQEIVDLTRGIRDPTQAAKKIVSFAEDVGAYVVFCLLDTFVFFGSR